ncbi:MAG: tetratricopeptide repeat protein, partial [Bacteroidales bacterium]|nr:tetratricopeptide repeat protein [Bacteroidales bacterium]
NHSIIRHTLKYSAVLTVLLATVAGCSTQKNTSVTRFYHNLTARYNVLFNGSESFNKGLRRMQETCTDDFSEILPVFLYGDPDVAQTIGSDMDRTIKKCSKLISLHSITVKPKVKNTKNLSTKEREFFNKKEYNKFVDDAYLLMGKAHFHKHDFGLASETFSLLINDFKSEPVVDEARIWLARTYNETRLYKNSEEMLKFLSHKEDLPKQLTSDLYTTYADFYLKQNQLAKAVEYLEKACEKKLSKDERIRYTFILAQLYERTGNLKKATDYYGHVIRMNPPYTMAFNALINRALTYQQGFGSSDEIEQELLKMLKDDKNLDYRDQIYYALGDLATKEGNKAKAIELYKKSVLYNTTNTDQKARSYLTLADLYYYIPDYLNAQSYYDSTVTLLDPSFNDYELINAKSLYLTRLVSEIKTFELEDSVQKLASLSDQELLAFIDNIIKQVREQEEIERQKEHERLLSEQFSRESMDLNYTSQPVQTASSKWYFYNDATKNMGYKEFKIRWGNRKLEDHWQRQNKSIAAFASGTESEEAETADTVRTIELSNKTREYYLRNVPRNDSMMQTSHKRAENALFNMGVIYKNELKDNIKAKESFRELLNRYPLSEHRLPVFYHLYSMGKEENDQASLEIYRNKIIAEFPESVYAKILSNPNYLKELEAEEKRIIRHYEETYNLFQAGHYAEVITRAAHALEHYPDDPLIPQYDYIRVLSLGKTTDTKTFRDALNNIIIKYPETEVSEASQNIIAYMNKEHPELLEEEEKIKAEKLYQFDENIRHMAACIVNKNSNNNQLVFNLINFNLDNYDAENLTIETVEINPQENLLLVKSFRGKNEASQYINHIRSDENVLRDYNDPSVKIVSITEENLKILLEDKSPARYLKFYSEHY